MSERDRTEWLALMQRIVSIRDRLYFSRRVRFDEELRPFIRHGRIAYPDAIYHVTEADVDRAAAAIERSGWESAP